MTSNLPPGVTDQMLPGNTPEDAAFEALCEALGEILPDIEQLSEETITRLAEFILDREAKAYKDGYHGGLYNGQGDE